MRHRPDTRDLAADTVTFIGVALFRFVLFDEPKLFDSIPPFGVSLLHAFCVFAGARRIALLLRKTDAGGGQRGVEGLLGGLAIVGLLVFPAAMLLGGNRLPRYFGAEAGDIVQFAIAVSAAALGFATASIDPSRTLRIYIAGHSPRTKEADLPAGERALIGTYLIASFIMTLAAAYAVGEENGLYGFIVIGAAGTAILGVPKANRLWTKHSREGSRPAFWISVTDGMAIGAGPVLWQGLVLYGSPAATVPLLLASGILPIRLLAAAAEGPRALSFWTGIAATAAMAVGIAF